MANRHLAAYLNDHLAGATAAIALLSHLEAAAEGTDARRVLAGLRADVTADRRELEALMGRLGVVPSRHRRVVAWLAAQAAALRLRVGGAAGAARRRLLGLEAVAVGIEGKRALWRALAATGEEEPGLRGIDYGRLEGRAEEQRRRVEALRLLAAAEAFAAP